MARKKHTPEDITALMRQYGRCGYRRATALLRHAGWQVNRERVERIWHREGLKVPQKIVAPAHREARKAAPYIAGGHQSCLARCVSKMGGMTMKLVIGACALLLAPAAAAQETTTYSYDALGRLKTTSTSGGQNDGTVNQVEFDRAGNRTNYTTTGATGTPSNGTKVIVVPLNGFTVIAIPNPWAAK